MDGNVILPKNGGGGNVHWNWEQKLLTTWLQHPSSADGPRVGDDASQQYTMAVERLCP